MCNNTIAHTSTCTPRVTKLGGETISDKEREAILNARKEAQRLYQQVGIYMSIAYSTCTCIYCCFDDPFPNPHFSITPAMLYHLRHLITPVQSAFVEEQGGKLDNIPSIILSLTPITMMHGVGAMLHCRGLSRQPGESSSSYEARRG